MTEATLQFLKLLSIGCVVAVAGSALSALAYPAFRRSVDACHPAARSVLVVCYALVTPAVAVAVVVLITHPDYSRLLVPDHCHHGACESHAPVIDSTTAGGLSLVAGGSLLLVGGLFAGLFAFRGAHRRVRLLFSLAQPHDRRGFLLVESPDLFAWCCGIWQPRILVSRGLTQRLSPPQLQMVLAHEAAHVRRMDNLRAVLVRWSTAAWARTHRSRILADLSNDAEVACDLEAAPRAGARADYVAALELMMPQPTALAGTAFGQQETELRIAILTEPDAHYRSVRAGVSILCVLWLMQIAALTGLTHILVEWVASLGL